MSGAHTAGPWRYRRGDEWSHSIVTDHGTLPDGGENCWTVADINKQRDEYEANARLIAAAPDMLSALRYAVLALAYVVEQNPVFRREYDVVDAAIWKAIGGGEA